MSHFSSICYYSPLNPQVMFYDGHDIRFDDGALKIVWSHHIQALAYEDL